MVKMQRRVMETLRRVVRTLDCVARILRCVHYFIHRDISELLNLHNLEMEEE